jgi:hypothetical protein
MSSPKDIGNLMHLYLDEIDPGEGTDTPEFLIRASAHLLNQKGGRNWIPIIVKQTTEDRYQVLGNSFVYAVAAEAGLERVWCIIADNSDDTAELTKILSGEQMPKINLSKASRDEIMAALEYLIEQPGSPLKTVKLAIATNRIDEAPRQYWKTLDPITKLTCGISKGKKLDALKQVFYLTPEPEPEPEPKPKKKSIDTPEIADTTDPTVLKKLTLTKLKAMAQKRGISFSTKIKKDALIELLSTR